MKFVSKDVTMDKINEHFGLHYSKNGWKYDQKPNEYVVQQVKEFFWKVTSKAKPPNHEFSLQFTRARVYEANDIELN
jgi:hypothetical protein